MPATTRCAKACSTRPKRVIDAYEEIYQGYRECPAEVLDRTFSETAGYEDFVLVKDIGFNSHCEHHMMPFFGKAHVAYMPTDRVVGLSKLARLVDVYAKRLQTQEHMTSQVATAIEEVLRPRGVAVMMEAEHMCMSLRGVTKPGALTVTTHFTGAFKDASEQVRFMTMLRGGGKPARIVSVAFLRHPVARLRYGRMTAIAGSIPCPHHSTSKKASPSCPNSTPTASSPRW